MKLLSQFFFFLLLTVFFFSCEEDEGTTAKSLTVDDITIAVSENIPLDTVIGQITVANLSKGLSYTIVSQSPVGAFAIDEEGQISVADSSLFDYESYTSITGIVAITAHGYEYKEINVSITVEDKYDDVPFDAEDFSLKLEENPEENAVLGQIITSISSDDLTYTINAQTPANAFSVSAAGEIVVNDASLFVNSINPTITGTVTITGAGLIAQEIAVALDLYSIWLGDNITFTKSANQDPTIEAGQDRITDNVWLTRGLAGGEIYNAKTETYALKNVSPKDTEWALGTIASADDITDLSFNTFRTTVGSPKQSVGKNMVLHLLTDDIYINIKFTSWSTGNSAQWGAFAYERSTANE